MEAKTSRIYHNNNLYSIIGLKNKNGLTVKVMDIGATILEILTPDKFGKVENVVMRYQNLSSYLDNPAYLGAVMGRTSGRVGDANFTIEDKRYNLDKNNGNNNLHGGSTGICYKRFNYEVVKSIDEASVIFTYKSPDGEGGFPGEVIITVEYCLNNNNELVTKYRGVSDKDTLLNLTNHSYFNLSGNIKENILKHKLKIEADKFTELDSESIVTGRLIDLRKTAFDFRNLKQIGKDINSNDNLLKIANGYDHYFKFIDNIDEDNRVELYHERSGRCMEISTNCNGVVVYSCNNLCEDLLSVGKSIQLNDAICLETQNSPIGRENLFIDSSILKKNEVYKKSTTFRFSIK